MFGDSMEFGDMNSTVVTSGLLTSLTEQQQQYIAQATVDAMSLTSDVLARRTLSHSGESNRSLNVPTFSGLCANKNV